MRRVIVPSLPEAGADVELPAAESHHLIDVIRVARGESVRVADGAGRSGVAVLADVRGGVAILRVIEAADAPPEVPRVVLLGLPKPALVEEALMLGTEAGASAFVLVRARHSPPGDPRLDRLARILQAAATQCGRARVPQVGGPVTLHDVLTGPLPPVRWLATPGGPPPQGGAGPEIVAIGPEGGWAPEEEAALLAARFRPAGLGPYTLRAPTAVAVALGRLWPGPTGS